MNYREIKTNGFLTNFINCFWEYNATQEKVEYTILPDGHFDLIIEITNNKVTDISLTGVWTKPVNIAIAKNTKLFGIRFRLLATEYIFKESIKELLNTKTQMCNDFWGANNFSLSNLEIFTNSLSQSIHYGLKCIKEIDNRKFKLFDTLYGTDGDISVKELAENSSWSSRQINRYFNQQFGFSLKTFCNILKCRASYNEIANGQLFPLRNYYDQAHYIKEVKRYTGSTPKDLYKNKNDRFLQLSTLFEK